MRMRKRKKQQPSNSQVNIQPQIQQPRPFITQSQTDNQAADLQTLQDKVQQPGMNFADIPIFAPHQTPNSFPIQPKLTIGQPNDKYEQEADAVAHQVVNQINSPQPQSLQREAIPEDEDKVQAKSLIQCQSNEAITASSQLESSINQTRGKGQPLSDKIKQPMEKSFGTDFSGVKIHTDAQSDRLNQSIQAKAFTTGQDIFFRQGAYNPSSRGGQELIAHELTHVVQQTGKNSLQPKINRAVENKITQASPDLVQCAFLDPAQIIASLENIPYIAEQLNISEADRNTTFAADDKDNQSMLSKESMHDYVTRALAKYQEKFASDDNSLDTAMMMTMAIDRVARVVAERVLNDPSVTSELALALLKEFKNDIKAQMTGTRAESNEGDYDEVLTLTETLVSDDPISKYMHREMSKENAAQSIRRMATDTSKTPTEMFDLMSQRFQASIASYQWDKLHDEQYQAYSMKETHGELSQKYFKFLFGNGAGNGDWWIGDESDDESDYKLKFSEDAQEKLAALRQEVLHPTQPAALPASDKLTDKQQAHLQDVEESEITLKPTVRENLIEYLAELFSIPHSTAQEYLRQTEQWLREAPITITVSGSQFFATSTPDTEYTPSTAKESPQKQYSEIFGRDNANQGAINHGSSWSDDGLEEDQKRGTNYLRFRRWKDQVMTGNREFSQSEMPVFGALNTEWNTVYGTDDPNRYGTNYYGDVHFLLNKENIQNRLVYTATDHGVPRKDPLLVLHDFAFGGSHTWIKDVKKESMVARIVNAAISKTPLFAGNLIFEVQIFGGVDLTRDVEKMVIAPSVEQTIQENIRTFATTNTIDHEVIQSPLSQQDISDYSKQIRYSAEEKYWVDQTSDALIADLIQTIIDHNENYDTIEHADDTLSHPNTNESTKNRLIFASAEIKKYTQDFNKKCNAFLAKWGNIESIHPKDVNRFKDAYVVIRNNEVDAKDSIDIVKTAWDQAWYIRERARTIKNAALKAIKDLLDAITIRARNVTNLYHNLCSQEVVE